jgi:hypothetical protein
LAFDYSVKTLIQRAVPELNADFPHLEFTVGELSPDHKFAPDHLRTGG